MKLWWGGGGALRHTHFDAREKNRPAKGSADPLAAGAGLVVKVKAWGETLMDSMQFVQLLDRARVGHTEVILAVVDEEPGLATRVSDTGRTLLLQACTSGHVDLAGGLLDRHADMHVRDRACGWDALIITSLSGQVAVARLLLDRGANVEATGNSGRNALFWAVYHDHLDLCLLLISRAAELTADALAQCGWLAYPIPSDAVKAERRVTLRAAFAEGPHESQVRRRNWERRRDFVTVLVCHDFQPLAARRAELDAQHPPLPPDVEIPPLAGPRLALLRDKILSHPGLWRIVTSELV